MINRILAALSLACALVFCTQAHADRSAIAFVTKSQDRHPAYEGRRSEISSSTLSIARKYLGTRPKGMMRRLWCAQWLGMVERKAGRAGTGSNFAKSYATYGKAVPISQARAGDIVVTGRKGGGHVGYALGAPSGGKIRLVSGNSGGRGPGRRVVAEGTYSLKRVIAVRRPS